MSPAHAGPNTSGLYALGNISPVRSLRRFPHNQRRQRENVLPTPPSGSAKTGGRDALKREPLACLPRDNRSTGLNQAGLPPPESESRTFHRLLPNNQNQTPTHNRRSASGGLNISAGLPPCYPRAPRGIWGGEFRSIANHPPQNPRYQLTIGIRRSRPKFLGVIFTPGAACRRLYSFRSTALITRFTISSSNPMPMMSAGDLSCST